MLVCQFSAVSSNFVEKNPPKKYATPRKIRDKEQSKQTFLQLDEVSFKEQVVFSFFPADIPLHKLNHPSLKSLLATKGKVLFLEIATQACVAKLASQKDD